MISLLVGLVVGVKIVVEHLQLTGSVIYQIAKVAGSCTLQASFDASISVLALCRIRASTASGTGILFFFLNH